MAEEPQAAQVQVSFVGGGDTPILFANHILVRSSPDGFLVSFAQSHGPYEVGVTPEELREKGVPARIIATVAIPPNRMVEMVEVLGRVLEHYKTSVAKEADDND